MVQLINHWFRFTAMLIALFTSVQLEAAFRGKAETRVDYYPQAPLFPDQSKARFQPSFAIDLELHESLDKDFAAAFSLFGKVHPNADRQYSGDVREAWLGYYGEHTEWRAGMLMERWGVLEAENIVDILNPRDAVEDFQGDVKLGIAGLQATYLGEQAQFDAWLLPYARPRHLAEGKDRFQSGGCRLAFLRSFSNPLVQFGERYFWTPQEPATEIRSDQSNQSRVAVGAGPFIVETGSLV
jgi:hypothetical protein